MRRLACALGVMLLLLPASGTGSAQTMTPYVIGGGPAADGEYPFVVHLFVHRQGDGNIGFFCGGTLVRPDLVLTAAHCVSAAELGAPVDFILAGVGTNDNLLVDPYGGVLVDVDVGGIVIHPSYAPLATGGDLRNDVALLPLQEDAVAAAVAGGADFAPDVLALNGVSSPFLEGGSVPTTGGSAATVAGWGLTSPDGSMSPALKEAALSIRSCDPFWDTPTVLCAGTTTTGSETTTCQGDSGGPLLVDADPSGDTSYVQVGITSFGPESCSHPANPPAGYTNVAQLSSWIEATAAAVVGMAQLTPVFAGASPYPVLRFEVTHAIDGLLGACTYANPPATIPPGLDCTGDLLLQPDGSVVVTAGALTVVGQGLSAGLDVVAQAPAKAFTVAGGTHAKPRLTLKPLAGDGSADSGFALFSLMPVAPFAPRFEAHVSQPPAVAEPASPVLPGDSDEGLPLMSSAGSFGAIDADASADYSFGDPVVWDEDGSASISVGDVRLMATKGGAAGTLVVARARDIGTPLVGTGLVGMNFIDDNGDALPDPGEGIYVTGGATVQALDVRWAVQGFVPSSQVRAVDSDFARGLSADPAQEPLFVDGDGNGRMSAGDAAFVDWDDDGVVTVGDSRLTPSLLAPWTTCILDPAAKTVGCDDAGPALALNYPYVAMPAPGTSAVTILGLAEDPAAPGEWMPVTDAYRKSANARAGATTSLRPMLVPLGAVLNLDTAYMPYAVRSNFTLTAGAASLTCIVDRDGRTAVDCTPEGTWTADVTPLAFPYVMLEGAPAALVVTAQAFSDEAATQEIAATAKPLTVKPALGKTVLVKPRPTIDPTLAILKPVLRPSSLGDVAYQLTEEGVADPPSSTCTVTLLPSVSDCTGDLTALAGGHLLVEGHPAGTKFTHRAEGDGLGAQKTGQKLATGRVTTLSFLLRPAS